MNDQNCATSTLKTNMLLSLTSRAGVKFRARSSAFVQKLHDMAEIDWEPVVTGYARKSLCANVSKYDADSISELGAILDGCAKISIGTRVDL